MCKDEWGQKIDKAIFPGIQGGPLMHVIAAKAVCFKEALSEEFKQYQKAIYDNAQALAASLTELGLRLVSGGTDNHLMLVDVRPSGLHGKQAEAILESVNITVNKNAIPFDPEKPTVTSGIRIGTPAVTTRGMNTADMKMIAQAMVSALQNPENEKAMDESRHIVENLCKKYPLYS